MERLLTTIPQQFRDKVAQNFDTERDRPARLAHYAMGAAEEVGEICHEVKRHWIYEMPLDEKKLLAEAGDALFYIECALMDCGFTIEDAMQNQIDKLDQKYPGGFSKKRAVQFEKMKERQS